MTSLIKFKSSFDEALIIFVDQAEDGFYSFSQSSLSDWLSIEFRGVLNS